MTLKGSSRREAGRIKLRNVNIPSGTRRAFASSVTCSAVFLRGVVSLRSLRRFRGKRCAANLSMRQSSDTRRRSPVREVSRTNRRCCNTRLFERNEISCVIDGEHILRPPTGVTKIESAESISPAFHWHFTGRNQGQRVHCHRFRARHFNLPRAYERGHIFSAIVDQGGVHDGSRR